MMNKGMAIVGFILCFLAGITLMYGIEHSRPGYALGAETAGAWSDRESPVPVDSKDPAWGNRTAPVTMVVFSDFECPFCSRAEATLDQLKTFYGKEKLRVVWKHSPLAGHARAKPAAEAAQGVFALAGNDAFWKFHGAAFKKQTELGTDSYVRWAKEAGVKDEAQFRQGLESHRWADKVDRDLAESAQAGVNSTPYFLVNGVGFAGAQPIEKFKEVIGAELVKAEAAITRGTKADKVYVEMSKQNKAAAPPPSAAAKKAPPPEEDKTTWKIPLGDAPVLGPDTALVTIVEFSDFQCPFSKRAQETLKQIRDTYGDKVRFAWKQDPLSFHPRAEPAAELSLFALKEKGSKAFWAMHDKLFALQPKLEDSDLEEAAKELGLDAARSKKAIEGHQYRGVIDADLDLAENVEASSTPHFFINGRRLVGAQPFEMFRAAIDEQMKNAEALLAKGLAPNRVYEAIMKTAKEAPAPEKKNVAAPSSANPARGGAHAKVVIQEFSDFQCPFCSRVEPVVKQIHDTYGDKIKLVWRNHPLSMHPDAPLAAEAAAEAFKQKGADAFWKMHDLLFQNQSTPEGLKRPALETYATQIGLDGARFRAALNDRVHKAAVDADAKTAEDAGITAAPAFVINGYYMTGSQPFAKFQKIIDRALAEAK
ncbi:MAG TPA: thioredoxin domain-containing protein [Polyangiaceae bacterium]|nr:thioredoxin domain-containing protein [Polyangiaceae bacterium]